METLLARLTGVRIACPICRIVQRVDVRISMGLDEICPGVFQLLEKGTLYAVCQYKNCRHIITGSDLNETETIKFPSDLRRIKAKDKKNQL